MKSDDQPEIEFGVFDPEVDVLIRERNLPHWFQPESATFITFRTADSLPREVCLRMQRELDEWLRLRGLPIDIERPNTKIKQDLELKGLSIVQVREYKKLRTRLFHNALDECHGECLLRKNEVASVVADAILNGNGEKYDVDRFIIMPNHVHAIAQFRKGSPDNIVGQSWMRFTARQINAALGRSGSFWEGEAFDHIIRSAGQFAYLQSYIANNPIKAKLKESDYYYWPQL